MTAEWTDREGALIHATTDPQRYEATIRFELSADELKHANIQTLMLRLAEQLIRSGGSRARS